MSKVQLAARREGDADAERVQSRHLARFELRLKEDRKRCRDTMVRLASASDSALSEEPAFTWDPAECFISLVSRDSGSTKRSAPFQLPGIKSGNLILRRQL